MICRKLSKDLSNCVVPYKRYIQKLVIVNFDDKAHQEISDTNDTNSCNFTLKYGRRGYSFTSAEQGDAIKIDFDRNRSDKGIMRYLHKARIQVSGVKEDIKNLIKQLDAGLFFMAAKYMDGTIEIVGLAHGMRSIDGNYSAQNPNGGDYIEFEGVVPENHPPLIYRGDSENFDKDFLSDNPDIATSGDYNDDYGIDYFKTEITNISNVSLNITAPFNNSYHNATDVNVSFTVMGFVDDFAIIAGYELWVDGVPYALNQGSYNYTPFTIHDGDFNIGFHTLEVKALGSNWLPIASSSAIFIELDNSGNPFIAEFQTSSPSETLELKFFNGTGFDPDNEISKIDWGDGVVEINPTHTSFRISHVYTTPGTHEIKIFPKKGKLVALHWNNTSDKGKIYSVLDWGDYFLVRNAFHGCTNLELKDAEGFPILEHNLNNALRNTGITTIKTFKDWYFSPVTTADSLIRRGLNDVNNLTSLDTSNMDLSNVVNFASFLSGMSLISYIDTSNWDVSTIEDMANFAWEATNLTINIDFSDPIKGSLNLKETYGFAGRQTLGNEPNINSIKLIATNIEEPFQNWLTYFKPFRNDNIEHLQLIDLNVDWQIQDTPNIDVDEFANSLRDLTGSSSCDIQMSQAQYDRCTPSLFTDKNWNIIIV